MLMALEVNLLTFYIPTILTLDEEWSITIFTHPYICSIYYFCMAELVLEATACIPALVNI